MLKRKVFYPSHRVVSIQLLANGEVVTSAIRKQCIIKKNAKSGQVVFSEQQQSVQFRSKAVVLSNGGAPVLHPSFYTEWFPFMQERKDRVLLADQFLKRDQYKATMKEINENRYKNIVIIGASHSGFSAAWLMLNGPATYNSNCQLGPQKQYSSFPDAPLKSNPHCQECCTCTEAKKKKEPKCGCLCKCWGFFSYKEWEFDAERDLPRHFEAGSVKILYRDRVRVFYGTVEQAKRDGYTDFSEHLFSNKNGFVYSYTGLRGDAKALYRKIKRGEEKRAVLVKAGTPEQQAEHVRNADLVVWACGYRTDRIPIRDHEGHEITLSQRVANTQYDIDGKCRLCTADGGLLTKTFGSGLAYPTRTNDGMMRCDGGKANPRADSFSLYGGWVANRILLNLLPKTMLDNKLHRTLRNSRKKAIENNANNNNNNSPSKKDNKGQNNTNHGGGNQSSNHAPKTNNAYKNVESVVKKQI